jgi:hypothetical protein
VTYPNAAEKVKGGKAEPARGEVKAEERRTPEEQQFAEDMQALILSQLELCLKSYELNIARGVRDDPVARGLYAQRLLQGERNIREVAKEILDYDPDSKVAQKVKALLKKFESVKKYGPTM